MSQLSETNQKALTEIGNTLMDAYAVVTHIRCVERDRAAELLKDLAITLDDLADEVGWQGDWISTDGVDDD